MTDDGFIPDADHTQDQALKQGFDPEQPALVERVVALSFVLKGTADDIDKYDARGLAEGIKDGLPDAWFDADENDGGVIIDRIQFFTAPGDVLVLHVATDGQGIEPDDITDMVLRVPYVTTVEVL